MILQQFTEKRLLLLRLDSVEESLVDEGGLGLTAEGAGERATSAGLQVPPELLAAP